MALPDEDKIVEDDEKGQDRPGNDTEEDNGDPEDATDLVEVIFKGNRRAVYRNSSGMSAACGDHVIVEADKGEDLGTVGMCGAARLHKRKGKRLELIRRTSEEEVEKWCRLREKETKAFHDFRNRVERRQMPMKPVDVEYQFDGKRICFYFTADHRVDFRELVRELASVYRTRIELRQIGVRDEAKRVGGIGACGRELCCSTFLRDFAPISSQMARDQNLSLNPSKLSGLCGRLKCCLRFEHDFYRAAHAIFPKLGTRILVNGTEGHISKVDFFNDLVTLKTEEGEEISLPVGALRQ